MQILIDDCIEKIIVNSYKIFPQPGYRYNGYPFLHLIDFSVDKNLKDILTRMIFANKVKARFSDNITSVDKDLNLKRVRLEIKRILDLYDYFVTNPLVLNLSEDIKEK